MRRAGMLAVLAAQLVVVVAVIVLAVAALGTIR
jgi:hypothetical protein